MRIGIQAISLNDEQYIANMLESLVPIQPAYVAIVDGGSGDGTLDIIDRYSKHLNIILEVVPWKDNFAGQRNNALAIAPPADWFMRIDTDESLSGPMITTIHKALSVLPDTCLSIRIKQINVYPDPGRYAANLGGWETHPRIFRGNLSGPQYYRWNGVVHESMWNMTVDGLKPIPDQLIWDWNVSVMHHGWLNQARRKEREILYSALPGSGIGIGDLTKNRYYVVRDIPSEAHTIKETE